MSRRSRRLNPWIPINRLGDGLTSFSTQGEGVFHPGKPRLLFAAPGKYLSVGPSRTWDVSIDGQRFLTVKLEETKPAPH